MDSFIALTALILCTFPSLEGQVRDDRQEIRNKAGDPSSARLTVGIRPGAQCLSEHALCPVDAYLDGFCRKP
jgi:hypothetical protein